MQITLEIENTCRRLQAEACNFIKKETLAQVLPCEFCEISKNTLSYRTPPVAASAPVINRNLERSSPSSFSLSFRYETFIIACKKTKARNVRKISRTEFNVDFLKLVSTNLFKENIFEFL